VVPGVNGTLRPSIRSTGEVCRDTRCAPTKDANCWGSLPLDSKFVSIVCRLGWLAQETVGFILVQASEELYPTSCVEQPCSRARVVCSRGYKLVRGGCQTQVPWNGCSVYRMSNPCNSFPPLSFIDARGGYKGKENASYSV
jgi:hypothetical protein